jgi:hypothetical protein
MLLVASIPGAVLQAAPNKNLPGGRKPAHLYEVSEEVSGCGVRYEYGKNVNVVGDHARQEIA